MKNTEHTSPRNWKEARRFRAWELNEHGWTQRAIAEALGITEGAVSQWFKAVRERGLASLKHVPSPGRPPRLTGEQLGELKRLLSRGAPSHGFSGDIWTCCRVGIVIEQRLGVRYDPSQVGRILKKIGWTLQKPIRRARQRDEKAIERWRDERWPEIKKKLGK